MKANRSMKQLSLMRWTWTCAQRILSFQHLSLSLQLQMKSWRTIFVSPPWHTSVNVTSDFMSYSLHKQPSKNKNQLPKKSGYNDTTHLGNINIGLQPSYTPIWVMDFLVWLVAGSMEFRSPGFWLVVFFSWQGIYSGCKRPWSSRKTPALVISWLF